MTPRWIRPPYTATVIRDRAEEFSTPVDWSGWHLTEEEDIGQSPEQHAIIELFISVLRQLARERLWKKFLIGGDAFFAWVPQHPLVRISPDIYLLFDPPPPPLPASWQTWLPGHHPPRLAVEIVSGEDPKKDYEEGPEKYAQLGAHELVIFDPGAGRKEGERVPLQIYERTDDGLFVLRYRGEGPGLLEQLRVFAVVCPTPDGIRLRLARDPEGTDLVATAEEARQQADEARRQAEEAYDRERASREEAQRELDLLRRRLGDET